MTTMDENIIEFPKAPTPSVTYHFAGFWTDLEGKQTWIDGIVDLIAPILYQTDYLGLKKMLSQSYDISEDNFVITSLNLLDDSTWGMI